MSKTMHKCAGPSCPGLPYRASQIAHPAYCAAPAKAGKVKLNLEQLEALGRLQELLQAAHTQAVHCSALGIDLIALKIDVCALDTMDERATLAYGFGEQPAPDEDAGS